MSTLSREFRHLGDERVEPPRQVAHNRRELRSGPVRCIVSHRIVHPRQLVIEQVVVIAHFEQLRVGHVEDVDDITVVARLIDESAVPGHYHEIVRVVREALPQQVTPRPLGERTLLAGQQRNQVDALQEFVGCYCRVEGSDDADQVILLQGGSRRTQEGVAEDSVDLTKQPVPYGAGGDRTDGAVYGHQPLDKICPRKIVGHKSQGHTDNAEVEQADGGRNLGLNSVELHVQRNHRDLQRRHPERDRFRRRVRRAADELPPSGAHASKVAPPSQDRSCRRRRKRDWR